jgi:four helix bundle protein
MESKMENPKYKDNLILNLTFEFALNIIEYTEELEQRKKFNMANQLFRCGTSIGANVNEAQNAESKADFIHKIKIALKEADETAYWLNLCKRAKNYPDPDQLFEQLTPVLKIMNKIIGTSKNTLKNNNLN